MQIARNFPEGLIIALEHKREHYELGVFFYAPVNLPWPRKSVNRLLPEPSHLIIMKWFLKPAAK